MLQHRARRVRAARRRRAAAEVIDRDEEIDAAFSAILRQLISYMMEDPRTITPALEIVFIAKSIERIGDHAKNIAEAVVQVVKGKDVRHASAEQIRAEVGAASDADDPRRRGRAGDPRAAQGQSRRRRLRGARRAADAEAAQRARSTTRCPTWCCSTGCCPGSRASRFAQAAARATRARASCRSSW